MKIKVGVMFGGKSTEHEISIISAIQAICSMNTDKYEIIPIYISKNNEMYVGKNIGNIESYRNIGKLIKESNRVFLINDGGKVKIVKYPKTIGNNILGEIDIIFPIVHGTNVEDGTLQGFINMLNIPYVGCDVTSSAVGMNKYVMKTVLRDNNIPVLDCKCCYIKDYYKDTEALICEVEEKIGYPMIVKPVNLGSSIGINKAKNKQELEFALETAFNYSEQVLIEMAITDLKEINCSVLGDSEEAQASECEEPVNTDEILSFNDKYISGGKSKASKSSGMASLKRKIPAEISDEMRDEIRTLAVKAFKCLGCNGVSRIDFMIDTKTNKVYLNEINTIPGSLSFYLWEPLGKKYSKLLDNLIALALKRNREQEGITFSFDSNVLSSAGGFKTSNGKA